MGKKIMTREELINKLIDAEIESMDIRSVRSLLRYGDPGYHAMDNAELIEQYELYSDDEIEIVEVI